MNDTKRAPLPHEPSWALLESFTLVARAGSLTQAARDAHMSQPTLSRHIAELEAQLGVQLFDRGPHGVRLTPQGELLWERAQRVGEQVGAFFRAARGLSERVEGVVRVSLSESISADVMGPWLGQFCREQPAIELEWVVDNSPSNLLLREADIALRMFKPAQLDLVTRRFGDVPLGFYAAPSYLARAGVPTPSTLKQHRWVGFDRDETFLREARQLGFMFERADFCFRSDSLLAQREAVRQGLGIGVLSLAGAPASLGLERVLPMIKLPPLRGWLVAHREVHTSARVRLVFDALASYLSDYTQALNAAPLSAAQP